MLVAAATVAAGVGFWPVFAGVVGTLVASLGLFIVWRNRSAIKRIFGAPAAGGALAVAVDAIQAYEKRLGQQDADIAQLTALVASQGQQISLLKELVTGRAAIDELIHLIKTHDEWERGEVDKVQARADGAAKVVETAATQAATVLEAAATAAAATLKAAAGG